MGVICSSCSLGRCEWVAGPAGSPSEEIKPQPKRTTPTGLRLHVPTASEKVSDTFISANEPDRHKRAGCFTFVITLLQFLSPSKKLGFRDSLMLAESLDGQAGAAMFLHRHPPKRFLFRAASSRHDQSSRFEKEKPSNLTAPTKCGAMYAHTPLNRLFRRL